MSKTVLSHAKTTDATDASRNSCIKTTVCEVMHKAML